MSFNQFQVVSRMATDSTPTPAQPSALGLDWELVISAAAGRVAARASRRTRGTRVLQRGIGVSSKSDVVSRPGWSRTRPCSIGTRDMEGGPLFLSLYMDASRGGGPEASPGASLPKRPAQTTHQTVRQRVRAASFSLTYNNFWLLAAPLPLPTLERPMPSPVNALSEIFWKAADRALPFCIGSRRRSQTASPSWCMPPRSGADGAWLRRRAPSWRAILLDASFRYPTSWARCVHQWCHPFSSSCHRRKCLYSTLSIVSQIPNL